MSGIEDGYERDTGESNLTESARKWFIFLLAMLEKYGDQEFDLEQLNFIQQEAIAGNYILEEAGLGAGTGRIRIRCQKNNIL